MEQFEVFAQNNAAEFFVETDSFKGVKMIAETVAEDIREVCGNLPVICSNPGDCQAECIILMATVENSPLLRRLEREGKISLNQLMGKREVFLMQMIKTPFAECPTVKKLLVIAGSDKRGTIYGMFRLSEMCGVSPLIYFGDAVPARKNQVIIEIPESFVSKEPSVKFRGFFINDEWPAFGNWCVEKFGGINAKAYRKIFELLLRLKGNYMWPAMWRSVFSEDGPGLLNAELADTLGIVIGFSHHEPMCRSGEEWQRIYKQYGNDSTWSFISNADAITEFWKDGIIRNRQFENVVTIGMRGENDSKLMPADATLKDNIEVLKKAIRTQHGLLSKYYNADLIKIPRMLAIYKEVEDYYFGDETCEGLKDWDELKDVIFLLSDDNYGQLRALPTEEDRNHPGGYGMYYHFDYHGAPVSYEWTNCNRLTKTWEQMTQAYEAGVRDMWIVNVGDLKGVEYPLCYFMELAYDYETWGSSAINQTRLFAEKWVEQQFSGRLGAEEKEMAAEVLEGYTKWNAIRSPEAMHEGIFHPVHFDESERVRQEVKYIMETAERLRNMLTQEALVIYQNMIYYPAVVSLNLVLMYLEAGRNKELAKRGCLYANYFAESVRKHILDDNRLVEEFHACNHGKWNHFMSSAHTGFRNWDDKDWTYPTVESILPIPGAKAVVSFRGSEEYHLGAHWQDRGPMVNDDFTNQNTKEVVLCLDSRGSVSYTYVLEYECPWLYCSEPEGRVELEEYGHKEVHFTLNRSLLKGSGEAFCRVKILFDNGQTTHSDLVFKAENAVTLDNCGVEYLFLESQGYCAIHAEHYSEKRDIDGKGFAVVEYLGREGAAIKSFPPMEKFADAKSAPYIKYSMIAKTTGAYRLSLFLLSRNPAIKGGRLHFGVSVNDENPMDVYGVSDNYYTEWFDKEWADGVLNHTRIAVTEVKLEKGRNDIYIYAGDPGVILEKIVLNPMEENLPDSYLGPQESYFFGK